VNPRQDRVLGRGLSALISGADTPASSANLGDREAHMIPLEAIGLNPAQPRKIFHDNTLGELAESIRQVGILQPILVRRLRPGETAPLSLEQRLGGGEKLPAGDLQFVLVAGERRLRAAHEAGLERIPALVCSYEETEALKVALLENIQRDDLNPVEEAQAYRQLLDGYGATQDELAVMLGKNRSSVANTLRLLTLEQEILDMLQEGILTRGHAKALLGLGDPETRLRLARLCHRKGLSVRECERRVRDQLTGKPGKSQGGSRRRRGREETREIRALRERTEAVLGTPVSIERSAEGKGTVAIRFFSDEDLLRILGALGVDTDLS